MKIDACSKNSHNSKLESKLQLSLKKTVDLVVIVVEQLFNK